MIRIIDETLCILEKNNLTKERILEWTVLAQEVGIKYLQISPYIYELLEGDLPEGFQYYMEVDMLEYLNEDFPIDDKIKFYFIPKGKKNEKEIESYQINDLEEPIRIPNRGTRNFIKITGLDKLIVNGCQNGIASLKKKISFQNMILCPEDTYCCATAIAALFLENKGYAVVTSMCGIGNKAATEQVMMAMHVMDRYMINRTFEAFSKIKIWMEKVTDHKISPIAPIFGNRVFYVESGVHVDGILKNSSNYEPYEPDLVGLTRNIVLGKHSGKNSIAQKLEEFHIKGFTKTDLQNLLILVKDLTLKKGSGINDQEFLKLVEGYEKNEKNA